MAANDHLSPGQFFHGTNADLKPGDHVDPSFAGKVEGERVPKGYTFGTGDPYAARYYGKQAAAKTPVRPPIREELPDGKKAWKQDRTPFSPDELASHHTARVYEVEPTGPAERDPDSGNSFLGDRDPVRSQHPFRVKRLVEQHDTKGPFASLDEWETP